MRPSFLARAVLRVLFLCSTLLLLSAPAHAQDEVDGAVARGVLFFSQTCGHCEVVINEHLPGIFERFGGEPSLAFDETLPASELAFYLLGNGQLDLLLVDVGTEAGSSMFTTDSRRLGMSQAGVPRLDIGDEYLVGSLDIPERLPALISAGLAADGIDWPAVPGIEDALRAIPRTLPSDASAPAGEPIESPESSTGAALPASGEATSMWDRVGSDPLGNGIAILVLVAMLASLVLVPLLVVRGSLTSGPAWLIPALAIIGIGVSAYLGFVEASTTEAVCGPVGDCNAVQQSEYASLFGIPIGIIGLAAYTVLLIAWAVTRVRRDRLGTAAMVLVAAIATGGMLFSVYLTFLEPFVIGATCMWCIVSAISITGLFWLTAGAGWVSFRRLRGVAASAA
jgi:uncharacterized membrane protein